MAYLKIIRGKQKGNIIELDENVPYIVSNNFTGDIYLDTETDEFSFEFIIKEYSLSFSKNNELTLISGEAIQTDQQYPLPIVFSYKDTTIAVNLTNDFSQIALTEQQNSHNITDELLNKGYLLHDDSEIQVEPKLAKYVEKIKNIIHVCFNYFRAFILFAINKYKRNHLKKPLLFYGILIGTFIIIIAASIFFKQVKTQNLILTNEEKVVQLKQNIHNSMLKLPNKFSNLKLSQTNNKYVLYGIVSKIEEISEVKSYFKNNNLLFNLITFEQVKPLINKILSQYKLDNITVSFSENSIINLSGLILSMSQLDDAEIAINTQLPIVGEIDSNQIFLQTDIDKDLDVVFASPDFKQRLAIEKDYANKKVTISGYLTNKELLMLQQKVANDLKKYNSILKIILNIQNVLDMLPFKIAEVYTGVPGWIVTTYGQKIYTGGSFQGITLVAINSSQIVFKGKFPLIIKLNDLIPGSQQISVDNNISYVNEKVTADENQKNNIIREELQKELTNIEQGKLELKSLKIAQEKTQDAKLRNILQNHIDNLLTSITSREHELKFYQERK